VARNKTAWELPEDDNAALTAAVFEQLAGYRQYFLFRIRYGATEPPAQSVVSSLAADISSRYLLDVPRSHDEVLLSLDS
jgi:hypothetical protein